MSYLLKIPCCKTKLKSIRKFVNETLALYPVPEAEASKMVLAVDEICSNLIIHSHNCNDKENLEIKIDYDPHYGFKFEIIDEGESFSVSNYTEPCLEEIIKSRRKGGMGLMLVKRIMDEVEFNCGENTGKNICRLYRKYQIPVKKSEVSSL